MEEQLDLLDEKGKPTGERMSKTQAHLQARWHASAHIWLYNSQGQILLQRRSDDKDTYPGLWDISVAGHVSAGETSAEGASRELAEEIGVHARPEELEYITTVRMEYDYAPKNWKNREITSVYFLKKDIDPEKLILQKEEVAEVRFFSLEDFRQIIATWTNLVPHDSYYQLAVSELEKRCH